MYDPQTPRGRKGRFPLYDHVIAPAAVPRYAGGVVTVSSPETGWAGAAVQGFRYGPSDVDFPAISHYSLTARRRGVNNVRRLADGRWSSYTVGPGAMALLTHSTPCRWVWDSDVDVVAIYLSQDDLQYTARQMYDREISDVAVHDKLSVDDPALHRACMVLTAEAARGGPGSRLLIESVTTEIGVRILRRHADIRFREIASGQRLSTTQLRVLEDYIRSNLAADLSLDAIAGHLGISRFHLGRRFRATTGASPHAYVMTQRVEHAQVLLRRTRLPQRDVAAQCGFSDASHMSRLFKQRLGVTPGQYRAATAEHPGRPSASESSEQ